jgi:N-acetylglucosaminyldiphosphoundecaprenol N-acetyl-beta-D-mannosaminyltransferase
MGVQAHAITERQCVALVAEAWREGRGGWLHTMNLDHLRMIQANLFFPDGTPEADLRVCDGITLVWASRLQGTPVPERVTGSDLIRSLTEAAAADKRSVFFLGGNPGSAEGAAAQLQTEFPGFIVAGTLCPDFGFEKDPDALRQITQALCAAKPDLVYVAVGSPKSERLIQDWKKLMPAAWWASIGISFSFVTGEVKRAPRWMQVSGLETPHRLIQEPRRLAKRYLVYGLPFAARLFFHSLRQRFTRSTPKS